MRPGAVFSLIVIAAIAMALPASAEDFPVPECNALWDCSGWSPCVGGWQSRDCSLVYSDTREPVTRCNAGIESPNLGARCAISADEAAAQQFDEEESRFGGKWFAGEIGLARDRPGSDESSSGIPFGKSIVIILEFIAVVAALSAGIVYLKKHYAMIAPRKKEEPAAAAVQPEQALKKPEEPAVEPDDPEQEALNQAADYVEQMRAAGNPDDVIRKALLDAGWDDDSVSVLMEQD